MMNVQNKHTSQKSRDIIVAPTLTRIGRDKVYQHASEPRYGSETHGRVYLGPLISLAQLKGSLALTYTSWSYQE
jgi:hypothetical protein